MVYPAQNLIAIGPPTNNEDTGGQVPPPTQTCQEKPSPIRVKLYFTSFCFKLSPKYTKMGWPSLLILKIFFYSQFHFLELLGYLPKACDLHELILYLLDCCCYDSRKKCFIRLAAADTEFCKFLTHSNIP